MSPLKSISWSELKILREAESRRLAALREAQAQQRAVLDLSNVFGGPAGPSQDEAAAQVADPQGLVPGDQARVQGGPSQPVQPVPMEEEDSLPSSVGSLSQEDLSAMEGGQVPGVGEEPDDEPQIISVAHVSPASRPDFSSLSNSEKRRARAAEKRAEKKNKIRDGTPANRGKSFPRGRGGKSSRGGRNRSDSGSDSQSQQASTSQSPRRAFPMLARPSPSPSRPVTPAPVVQPDQPRPSTSGADRSEPQLFGAGKNSTPAAPVGVKRQGAALHAREPPAIEQEDAQAAGNPLVVRRVSLPYQDHRLASLEVRLT